MDNEHLGCRPDVPEEVVYDSANHAVGSRRNLELLFKTVPVPWLKEQTLPLVVTMTPQTPQRALLPPELTPTVAMEKCRSVHVTLDTPTMVGSFDATACPADEGGTMCVILHEVWGTEDRNGIGGNDSALTPHGDVIRAIARSLAAQLEQARKDPASSLSAAAFVGRISGRKN